MRDFFGRELSYVRISVTDRCNYRCRYCMPGSGVDWIPHDRILPYEDILFLVGILCELGVKKIRFTGGEPLVRKGMIPFLEKVSASFPELQVALTTNGSTLAQYAKSLVRILKCVNISLDTLDAEKFSAMTRGASLEPVLDGINALTSLVSQTQIEIKMNTVLMRGFNDDMIERLVNFAFEKGILLRFIEFMPLHSNLWDIKTFMPFSEALARLSYADDWVEDHTEEENSSSGPARYYVNSVTGQRIGVISAVSRHFCKTCNRLRFTSTGDVRPCLFGSGQVSIAGALRSRDEKRVRELISEAVSMKPGAGTIHYEATQDEAVHRRKTHMHAIGG